MRLIILISTIFLSSCGTQAIRVQVALPEKQVLPKITGIKCPKEIMKFIACFTKENYKKLVKRDAMQKSRNTTLRKLILDTRK